MADAPVSDRTRWAGLVFISIAVALIIVDSTIVNVAIPSVVDELDITSTQVQWVQESYTLVFAALLLVFGTLADRFGRRRILLIGVVIFALSSVVAAAAPTGDLLIASRVVQGVGGAMILPATLSLINATFRGRERGIAFAVWGSTIGGMAAVGPLLGGWLTTYFSWRWAFGINLPLGIIIVIGVLVFVRESRADDPQRVDVVGAALSIVLFTSLVFGLIEGRTYGWWLSDTPPGFWTADISPIPFAFALALIALIAFIAWGLHRQRVGRSTMIAFGLFGIASFRNGNIAAMIVSLGEFGIILSLPLWLQNVLGYDALQTGFVLLALAGGAFIASGLAGATSGKVSPLGVVRFGIVAEIVGLVIVGLVIAVDTPWWAIAGGLVVYGFGVGLATAQLTGVVLADVPVSQSGQASGTQSTSRQVGSALGIAILGTILFSSLGTQLADRLADDDLPSGIQTTIVDLVVDSAGSGIAALEVRSPEVAQEAREAFSEATRYSAFSAAGFLGLGLLATIGLGGRRRRQDASAPPVSR
ncbi:MAG TPA: DHA2 family efflux MFS transporter permease subunit [Pseudolysinimonas sp.]|nr:DHA2 family efflux MFS transporter permease subunit [Pseudolysinimonas sp.]